MKIITFRTDDVQKIYSQGALFAGLKVINRGIAIVVSIHASLIKAAGNSYAL
jgi:hypothetical protein